MKLQLAVRESERRGDARPVEPINKATREQWRGRLRDVAAELATADRLSAKGAK